MRMNESEIFKKINEMEETIRYKTLIDNDEKEEWEKEYLALQGLIRLYQKEKEFSKKLEIKNNQLNLVNKTIIKDYKEGVNEKAYKIYLLVENELEEDLYKSEKQHEFKACYYLKNVLSKLRRKYKDLVLQEKGEE